VPHPCAFVSRKGGELTLTLEAFAIYDSIRMPSAPLACIAQNANLRSVPKRTVSKSLMVSFECEMGDMPPLTLLARPLPTCGVAAGMPCLLHSGGLRIDPHIDRKLDAIEAVKREGFPVLEANYCLTKQFENT